MTILRAYTGLFDSSNLATKLHVLCYLASSMTALLGLLGSKLGTKSYVLRYPRTLHLCNSRLFSQGPSPG